VNTAMKKISSATITSINVKARAALRHFERNKCRAPDT
jgi:hypothetical protein